MKVSYKDFRDKLRREIWPFAGEAKNLREPHNAHFKEAMTDLGKWIPCLQNNNTSVFQACGTYVECAITALPCPNGLIKHVYTIVNEDWCDRVFAASRRYQDILEWSRELMRMTDWVTPARVTTVPALQKGFRHASSETDGTYGRSRTLIYAIYRKRLYLAPWIQSNESVVVEWDGYKTDWSEADQLDLDWWSEDIQAAVKQYVRMAHERDFGGDTERYMQAKLEYASMLADGMHWCREKTKQIETEIGEEQNIPTADQLADEAIPVETVPSYTFGIVGDFGKLTNGTAAQDVADMIISWAPDHIIGLGDAIYPPETDFTNTVGVLYGDYVTADLTTNKFWPAIGNHDYTDPGNTYSVWEAYFTLPHVERYYDMCFGPVHFFFYNSDSHETDGYALTSKQAEWLRVKIALSTATWKIVCKHHPYPSSDPDPGHAAYSANFDFPWDEWGVDVVMGGHVHAYERLLVDGVTHLVCGFGGQDLDTFGAANANSVLRYDDNYGAVKLVATEDELHFTAINRLGVTVDDFTLT